MTAALLALSLLVAGVGAETAPAGHRAAESVGVVRMSTHPVKAAPRPSGAVSAHATYYCRPGYSRCTRGWSASCMCAAISPDLRRWAGSSVRVWYRGRSVRVRIIDCNCQAFRGIDLYAVAFRALAPLWMGRMGVTLTH